MKTLFEQIGGMYVRDGDYLIPNLSIPDSKPIGKYGMLCKSYLKNHRPLLYNSLFTSGKLFDHLADIDRQADELKDNLLPKYMAKYGVTEQLKACKPMEWVQLMNMIAHQIDEAILKDIVYNVFNQ